MKDPAIWPSVCLFSLQTSTPVQCGERIHATQWNVQEEYTADCVMYIVALQNVYTCSVWCTIALRRMYRWQCLLLYSGVLLLPLQSSLSIKEKKNILATEKVRQKLKQNNYSLAVFKLCEMLTKLAGLMSMSVLDIIIKILRFFSSTRKFLFLKK